MAGIISPSHNTSTFTDPMSFQGVRGVGSGGRVGVGSGSFEGGWGFGLLGDGLYPSDWSQIIFRSRS